jgi:hypothetical protein
MGRQAAKVLGVDKRTIARDVGQSAPENGAKGPSPDEYDPENDSQTIDEEHEEGLRVIAARGFLNRAVEAKKICTIGKLQPPDKIAEDRRAKQLYRPYPISPKRRTGTP